VNGSVRDLSKCLGQDLDVAVCGSVATAEWLTTLNRSLLGVPLDMCKTEEGRKEVLRALGWISHGLFG
jgi:hypothetical protein